MSAAEPLIPDTMIARIFRAIAGLRNTLSIREAFVIFGDVADERYADALDGAHRARRGMLHESPELRELRDALEEANDEAAREYDAREIVADRAHRTAAVDHRASVHRR